MTFLIRGRSRIFRPRGSGGGSSLCDLALSSQGDEDVILNSDGDIGDSPQTIDAAESDPAWSVDGSGRLIFPEDGLYLVSLTGYFEASSDCTYLLARLYCAGTNGSTVPLVPEQRSRSTFSFLDTYESGDTLRPQGQLNPSGEDGEAEFACDVRIVRLCGPVVEG